MTIRQHAAAAAALALLLAPLALFAQETKKLTDSSVPATVSIADADYLYVVQGGVSKRGTAGQLRAVTDSHVANDLTLESSATIGTDSCVRIGDADAATNAVQICRSTADDRLYHDTDADGTKDAGEEFIDASGGGASRLPSLANPPASGHTYDCEFTDGVSGCTSWSINTGALASGTASLFSVLTDPIYDSTTWPGWLLVQSEDDTTQPPISAASRGSITQATDEQWTFRVFSSGGTSATNEARSGVCLSNSGDSNEGVCAGLHTASTTERLELYCNNNGTVTAVNWGNLPDIGADEWVLVLQKVGNDYYFFPINPSGAGMHGAAGILGRSCTKTGVTSFDIVSWVVDWADETPSRIMGVDFIRYKTGSGLPAMNP